MFRSTLAAVALAVCATSAQAQWAEKLFEQRSHDFGAVPRAAKVEYTFVVKNPYNEDIHISSVRSSCGCTQPRIGGKDIIKPNEEGAIVAEFNTRSFTGQRGARVTVTIDRPRWAEVQLDVKGYIRTDVVLNPSLANLGAVTEGDSAAKKIKIEYAGRDDWKITGAKVNNEFLTADVKEVARGKGRVSYELDVQLKDGAPAGYLNDQIILTTNDIRATQFPVAVEGNIVAELTVSPAPLLLGTLAPGQRVTKQIVVKGAVPFKITSIHCDNSGFEFKVPTEAKTVHLVPVTFEAGPTTGKISESIQIVTDLGNNKSANLPALGQISSPLAGK